MTGRLKDKVCIITGTGSGMGRAAALLFCKEGAKVVGSDINADNAQATLRDVQKAGGQMVSLQPADLTKQERCDALVDLALKSYGGIDVVYNNAATAYFGWMDKFTYEEFARTIEEELLIVFRFCKTVWPHLVARGGGSIINVASTSAKVAYKALPGIAHTAAKGGVLAMTRQLAMEGGKHKIRANTISPGLIETGATRELLKDPNFINPMMEKLMVGRVGQPEDVAPAAVYLASDESLFVTGADIAVDGGTTAW
ncbi:MAG TPA: SDR family NAD(P)-dependent oxidoreductase [Xanthobacteraceae bacterium]|jgi:NAD(P)-dependent dehydrogenase (short-subunit alcohol dehydrogenase family)|nr:SDR family NAD(P)-dependent oxidoreductase [Xanthobacteraceae bacterium]